MSRIAYVNGRYCLAREACVNVEDRGYQFADGVYEVCEVRAEGIVDLKRHMVRLQRSLGELRIAAPMALTALEAVMREVIRRNRVSYGLVYLQVTRGVARRDHAFPVHPVKPSLVVTARNLNYRQNKIKASQGISVITLPDNRWARVDIKSVGLLPNVLARQAARDQGAYDAWFVDREGLVTEGAASNAWIVTKDRRLVTRQADHGILSGITRSVVKDVLLALQLTLEERAFSVEEAKQAAEAFVTSSSQIVMPVIRIDGSDIGNGQPGPISKQLREEFHRFSQFS